MFGLFELSGLAAVEILAAIIPESVGIFVAGFLLAMTAVAIRRIKPVAVRRESGEAEQN